MHFVKDVIAQGPLSARPDPGVQGRLFRQTDVTPNVWWQDTGTAWQATVAGDPDAAKLAYYND